MTSVIPTEAIDIHNELVFYLGKQIVDTKLHELKNLFKNNPLFPVDIASIKSIYDLFDNLMGYKTIVVGDYTQFVQKLKLTNPDLERYVKEKEKEIKSIVERGPSPAKQPRPGYQGQQQSTDLATMIVTTADTIQAKKIHPDLEPMIGESYLLDWTWLEKKRSRFPQNLDKNDMHHLNISHRQKAKAKIKKENEKEIKFHPTKGFWDAKEKLLKNRVVVIKGNTGDGKTAIAFQLLHLLREEQQAGQPLQIHEIKKLDLLAPNLKLITFIDDIFGEIDASKSDVQEWNKRISDVDTLFVDEQAETNFLIITIRNEVFNSLEKRSLGKILTKDNIIDLSSYTYKLAEEKKQLLELYKPKNFSWTDQEKTQISTYAPNIGFPQCCQLFYNSKELQKERVRFYENPFHFLNEALSRLQECSALLYLFLNGGMMIVKDLDPNSKTVNEKLLEEAFEINLIGGEDDSTKLTYKKKVGFVKENLEKLLGFLVVKETHWSGEDVYRFNHDSIYVAVAFLYGKATPIGYIQNCPSKSLSYLTTSKTKTATNMIVISSDHYTEMCERLLREFECEEKRYGTSSIGTLDVWNDPVFVEIFVRLLNDRKVDKLAVLNKACYLGAEECVLYLLSEGVKPHKYTRLWSLIDRHRNDSNRQVCLLQEIVVYLNDETKLDLLNEACSCGAEECVVYLLSEGVKPDKDTALWSLFYRHWNDSNRQECLLKKIVVYLNDETKLDVLKETCNSGAEECVLYLLSEGVKPDEDTELWSLIDRHRNDSNRQVCLLKKIVVYMNDETKLDLLNEACSCGAEECVVYLLSEGVKPDKDTALSLIDRHRNDGNRQVCLLKKIVVYMNDETKLDLLNEACSCGAEECVVYLLSEGVKPDKDTALSLIDRHRNDGNRQVCLLKKIVVYMNDETKLDLLNEACSCGAEECVVYLLSEGVKPDKDTALSLIDRHRNDGNRQVCLLKKIVVYMNDETKLDLLNEACSCGAEECVVYLLSEGVKPDKDTALSLIDRHRNDGNRQVCLLKKIVVYLNDETKLDVLNEACSSGAEECVLYFLFEGVEPDKDTAISAVEGGSVKVLRKLLEYDVTPTARDYTNSNVLHKACQYGREEMVTLLCDTYPHLVHDTDDDGRTPLHDVAGTRNCSMFKTVERFVLNSLYRVEDQHHKCESEDGRVIHRNCVCAQYMAQLVGVCGRTVLHKSCASRNRE
ncbi:uncharacterized protein LOC110450700, partial [Mizuhopecten yessoensis]|uniref:uncharacterized protein LOC110450700 n=1 Tax=Mizuhopecten yessoensis TaxID=6573 RepID=UPI000B45D9B6